MGIQGTDKTSPKGVIRKILEENPTAFIKNLSGPEKQRPNAVEVGGRVEEQKRPDYVDYPRPTVSGGG